MKLKLTDTQTARLKFTHVKSGKPSELFIAMNPLTGDWLQDHRIGDTRTSYISDKPTALKLANNIIDSSQKNHLHCSVEVMATKRQP